MKTSYGVATINRLLKIVGLFCKIPSFLYGSFAKETYNFKAPTDRSHLIVALSLRTRREEKTASKQMHWRTKTAHKDASQRRLTRMCRMSTTRFVPSVCTGVHCFTRIVS